ncbi:MAG TPA: DUF222 domain-containing protein [Trebonia sp.]|jgi:hypothetical protein|nr:DUF222 domain-containing protein [Trebonia sp.]
MTDDAVFGVLGRWAAVEGWVAGRKLAVARELIRRRPDEEGDGTATGSSLPWEWDDRLAHEVALELRMSVPAARKLLGAAWALEARLPGIGQALDEGQLDLGRVKMVVEETSVLLEPEHLARAEEIILAGLDRCRTWAELLRLVQRAVVTVDPEGAARRREKEERENARVSFWREAAGTCALMGSGLPTDEALQAHARVDERAQQYRAAGVKRPIDILRVAAYLDLLNLVPAADRIDRFQAEDAATNADDPGSARPATGRTAARSGSSGARPDAEAAPNTDASADTGASPDVGAGPEADPGQDAGTGEGAREAEASGRGDAREAGAAGTTAATEAAGEARSLAATGAPAGLGTAGAAGASTGSGSAVREPAGASGGEDDSGTGAAVSAEVNLVLRHLDIPFLTAAGLARRAGEARSLGVLDPALARQIAEAAARHPGSKFCLTVVDDNGHAIGHGCCRPRPRRKSRQSGKPGQPHQQGVPPPAPVHQGPLRGGHDGEPPAAPWSPGPFPPPALLGTPWRAPSPPLAPPAASPGAPHPSPLPSAAAPPEAHANGFTLRRADGAGPPGGHGSWVLTLPGQSRELLVDLHPVPTGECGHEYESAGHDPGERLRHLVNVRDGKCGFPACSRHARETDFEHGQPFEHGGRTCGCNCWSCSRSCHQVKQSPGWSVREVTPGYHEWTTPSGRTYTQEPWRYPA